MLATWRSAPDHLRLVRVEVAWIASTCQRRLCSQKHGSRAGNSHQVDRCRKCKCNRRRDGGPGRVHEPLEADLQFKEKTESAQKPIPGEHWRPDWQR